MVPDGATIFRYLPLGAVLDFVLGRWLALGFQGMPACSRTPARLSHSAPQSDARYAQLMNAYAKTHLLVLDDWGRAGQTDEQRSDLFEAMEDRYDRGSTRITSQVPVNIWHQVIGDPTLGEAILDRLVHNAHKITHKGESIRKKRNGLVTKPQTLMHKPMSGVASLRRVIASGTGGRIETNCVIR